MNRLITFLYSLLGSEYLEQKNIYVYVDIEDDSSIEDDSPMREITKKEILNRYKSIYQHKKMQIRILGWVVYNKIYIVEIKKIPFSELKESFKQFKKKQKILYTVDGRKDYNLVFLPTSQKLDKENPYLT
jgi:hypothetical protein